MEKSTPSVASSAVAPASSAFNPEDLLRFEQALLLSEQRFLEAELKASPDVSLRMTSSRLNETAVDYQMLSAYLDALQSGDVATCVTLEEKMREKVASMRRKAALLEKILRGVRKEVRIVLDHSVAAAGPESSTAAGTG